MVITFYGQSCFKIETQGITIAIDPFSKELGLTPPRFKADLLFITHEHSDHANREAFKDAFVIDGPGEYDVKGVAAKGIFSFHDAQEGKERGVNAIYRVEAENIALAHMGDFGQKELSSGQLEALGAIDILMVPAGGNYTIDAETAVKITAKLEPKIVIPMHYALPKITAKLETVEQFLKEIGQKPQPMAKLAVKKKDLGEDGTKVAVLTPPALATN